MKRLMLIATALAMASPLLAGNRVRTPVDGVVRLVRTEPQPFQLSQRPVSSTEAGPAGVLLAEPALSRSGRVVVMLEAEAPTRARVTPPAGFTALLHMEGETTDGAPPQSTARKPMSFVFDDGAAAQSGPPVVPARTNESVKPSTETPVQE